MNIYVFLSYGHDKYADYTRMLFEQLSKNDNELAIWWDNKLEVSDDWVIEIEKQLNRLVEKNPDSCLIYLITPYSANTLRDNFCIKEIVKAIGNNVRVIPVKLADAPMPLLLGNLQWIDLTDININSDNKEFINRIDTLCNIIKKRKEISGDGKQAILMSKLEPCTFTLELDKHLKNYEARSWLLQTIKEWIEQSEDEVLLLLGGPGTGKTAFSVWMSYCELSEYVVAWHLCQYNDKRTCNLRNVVKSIAYYLSTRIPAYYHNLDIAAVSKILQEAEFDAATLFKYLILTPLQNIGAPEKTMVILIDALDEASQDNNNDLAEIISQYIGQLPKWLKIIITSRNDYSVTTHLKDKSKIINLDDISYTVNSTNDIHRYVEKRLGNDIETTQKVAQESGNNFLYAQLLCESITNKNILNQGKLPLGINGCYNSYLKRYFKQTKFSFYENALPLLHLILTLYEPLPKEVIYSRLHKKYGEWCINRSAFMNLLKCFGPLLKEVNGCILPFHKSLFDWFLDCENNVNFFVSREDGLDEVIEWGFDIIKAPLLKTGDGITRHFYHYLPQYLLEAGNDDFVSLYLDVDFWKNRYKILGITLLLRVMIDELTICPEDIKKQLFFERRFFDILNLFNIDLFNTGKYVNLYQVGYTIPITTDLDDNQRLFAIRYYYINELYDEIVSHIEIFEKPYQDHIIEALLMNELGQTYRKFGQLELSAHYYRKSLDGALKYGVTLDEVIYTRLNLSRILTMQCRNEEARQLLNEALVDFNSNLWMNSIQGTDIEFSSQQLIRGVRYVELETENFSLFPNDDVCHRSLKWANETYSDPHKRDRYYPNHLISKLFYMIKTGCIENPDELIKECENSITGKYDRIRLTCVRVLMLICLNKHEEALRIAKKQLEELITLRIHLIQRTELAALIGFVTKTDQTSLISEEMIPWYNQVQKLATYAITKNNGAN